MHAFVLPICCCMHAFGRYICVCMGCIYACLACVGHTCVCVCTFVCLMHAPRAYPCPGEQYQRLLPVLRLLEQERARQTQLTRGLQERLTKTQEEASTLQTGLTQREHHLQQLQGQMQQRLSELTQLEREVREQAPLWQPQGPLWLCGAPSAWASTGAQAPVGSVHPCWLL